MDVPPGFSWSENEKKIANTGRIPLRTWRVSLGIFFAIAAILVVSRLVARLHSRRRLFLDDAFLTFGLMCLCAASGLAYHFSHMVFLVEAVNLDPTVVVPPDQYDDLLQTMAVLISFIVLAWTCTFAIKASFLSLFFLLIRRVSRSITIYYWIVVGVTTISWIFVISEPFILCPYFGTQSVRCFPQIPWRLNVPLTTLVTILDITTDAMIVMIPVVVLRKTQMRLTQKIGLGTFMCLSIVMATSALVRISGFKIRSYYDITWSLYWQYMEGCIACVMASISSFRTLFIQNGNRIFKKQNKDPSPSMKQRMFQNVKKRKPREWFKMHSRNADTVEIPSATLSGMQTFIRENNGFDHSGTHITSNDHTAHEETSLSEGQYYAQAIDDTHSNQVSFQVKNAFAGHAELV